MLECKGWHPLQSVKSSNMFLFLKTIFLFLKNIFWFLRTIFLFLKNIFLFLKRITISQLPLFFSEILHPHHFLSSPNVVLKLKLDPSTFIDMITRGGKAKWSNSECCNGCCKHTRHIYKKVPGAWVMSINDKKLTNR